MEIGTLLLFAALAYGLGLLWYELVPGHVPSPVSRVMAYPFVAMVLAEVFVPVGPTFGGVHIVTALGATLLGVVLDLAITAVRRPVATPMTTSQTSPLRS